MSSPAANRLLLVAAAVLFSTGGAAIKATTLAGPQVASFRSLIAAVTLLALVPAARRGWDWRAWPVGAAYAATLALFVLANKLTFSANAIFLQATAPLYLLFIGPLLLGERVGWRNLGAVSPVFAGLLLVFAGGQHAAETAPDPARGNLFGAVTGFTWALTVSGLRWLGRHPTRGDSSIATVAAGNLIAFAAMLPMALPIARIGLWDLLTLAYLGVFQIGLAYFCVTRAIRHVPAFEASMLLLVEPALNPVWTWLVEGERPGVLVVAGGVLILAATLIDVRRGCR